MILELYDDLVIIFPTTNYHIINLFITHVDEYRYFQMIICPEMRLARLI